MELSAYETKRQRRIEQNQQKLQALNVPKIPQRIARVNVRKIRDPVEPVRRSVRLRDKAQETETFVALEFESSRPKRVKTELLEPLDLPVTHPMDQLSANLTKKQHISSSQLEIQLSEFHDRCLGTQLLPVGKQTAMQGLCPSGYEAKFSKMSGVQPWKNALVLFVNVERDSRYDNVFHQEVVDGRRVVHFQWFGQNRWHEESPLVVRLRGGTRGDESLRFHESFYDIKEGTRDEPLLLFLRHTQGPYIYCGRLGYLGYRPVVKPLEFRWQLLDVDSLEWEKIRALLATSSAPH